MTNYFRTLSKTNEFLKKINNDDDDDIIMVFI